MPNPRAKYAGMLVRPAARHELNQLVYQLTSLAGARVNQSQALLAACQLAISRLPHTLKLVRSNEANKTFDSYEENQ